MKLQWVSLSAVLVAGLVLQTLVAVARADDAKRSAAEKPAALTVLSDDAHELKQAFNADQGTVRVLMIVSPSCPTCRSGAAIVERALSRIPTSQLKVYVVWIHRLYRDNRQAAQEAAGLVSDPRARHFWDGGGRLGTEYGKLVSLPQKKKFAWDVYFVFGPKTKWTDAPPKPDFWMHQLGGPETGNMLDGEKFRQEIIRRLP